MNKTIMTIFLLAFAMTKTFGQPLCFPPPGDAPMSAPIVECLDGYTWATDNIGGTFILPGFCGELHNSQWIAFVAQTSYLDIQLDLNGCLYGRGLQMVVYGMHEPCDIYNLYEVSNCFSDPNGNPIPPSVTATNLQIGHVYYIMIDGWDGDQCGYTIHVNPTFSYPPPPPPILTGPTVVSSGSTVTYQLEFPEIDFILHNPCDNKLKSCCQDTCSQPTEYIWTAPAGTSINVSASGQQAEVTWGEIGGEVCVEIKTCAGSSIICLDVTVIFPGSPCTPNDPVPPGDSCHTATLFCGVVLNGYCSNNTNATADQPGNLASLLPCSIENNQYIKFVADSSTVRIMVETNNCTNGEGLELSLFTSSDCEDFQMVSVCSLLPNNSVDTLEFTGLTTCGEYFFMIDGINGDACDYRFFLLSGIEVTPITVTQISPGCITGPTPVCVGATLTYSYTLPVCIVSGGGGCGGGLAGQVACDSTVAIWRVPKGMIITSDSINVPSITVEVVDTFSGYIYIHYETIFTGDTCDVYCGSGSGGCGIKPLWVDIDFEIIRLPDIILCEGECAYFCDELYCWNASLSCIDSCIIYLQDIIVIPNEDYFEEVVLCPGECYDFFGRQICGAGSFVEYIYCEGFYFLTVTESQLFLSADVVDASCNGSADGSIFISHSGGSGGVSFNLGGTSQGGSSVFTGLSAGNYAITAQDGNGCTESINVTVNEPTELQGSTASTDVTCYGGSDGSITIVASGGTSPYQYSTGGTGSNWNSTITGLSAGTYTTIITDNNGCSQEITTSISEPTALQADAYSISATCGSSNGAIDLSTSGGTPPYTYDWGSPNLSGLSPGYYEAVITDNNGCSITAGVVVDSEDGPTIQASSNNVSCNGGADGSISLDINNGAAPYTFEWSNAAFNGQSNINNLAVGIYCSTVTDANGCSSTYCGTVNEPTAIQTALNEQICQGNMVVVGAQTYSTSGVYTNVLSSNTGCDSIVTLNLNVLPQLSQTINEQICQGDAVLIGNQTYTTSGTFVNVMTSNSGCDSIVTLNLNVLPQLTQTINEQICQGDIVVVGGQSYNSSGTFVNTLTSDKGCDSIVTLNLNVLPQLSQTVNEQICQGDILVVGGQSYNSSGTFVNTLTSNAGCDSIVTLNLNVLPQLTQTINEQICQGDAIVVGGQSYNSSGTFVNTLTSDKGCDSIVTLNLNVLPQLTQTINEQICQGDAVVVGGQTYNSSGTFVNTLTSDAGCDSIVTMNLNVLPQLSQTINEQVCQGDAVVVGGQSYNSSGTFVNTLTSDKGCDSIVTLNLNVLPQLSQTVNEQICQGDILVVGGQSYNSSGTFVNTLTSNAGCDSIVTLNLNVLPQLTQTINEQICQGDAIVVGGQSYNSSGTFVNTLTSDKGCDSIVTLNLNVLPQLSQTVNEQICQGDIVVVGGQTYNSSGTFVNTLTSDKGCDSIVTLNLNVLPQLTQTINEQICQGDIVVVGGQTYNSSGTFVNTLTSDRGCDSIVTLNLNVLPQLTQTINEQICQGDIVVVGGQTYNSSGTFVNTLTSNRGCDSIVTLNLNVLPQQETLLNIEICTGDSYELGGNIYTTAGTYTHVQSDVNGCDSTIQVNLSILLNYSTLISDSICKGESVQVGSTVYNTSGSYLNTFTASNGCDSIVTLDLWVVETTTTDLGLIQLCEGECYTLAGEQYCDAGTYNVQVVRPDGCSDDYLFTINRYTSVGPTIGPMTEECDPSFAYYTISFDVLSGIPPYSVNGQLIAGGYYFSSPIPTGTNYYFEITDSDQCPKTITIEGSIDCTPICDSYAGNMSQEELAGCEGEFLEALHLNDAVVESDDATEYVLHTGNGTQLGDVIDRNKSGQFEFIRGIMDYERTYFISLVVGNEISGEVDLADRCLSVAAGQPIVFYSVPIAEAGEGDTLHCNQTELVLQAEGGALSGAISYQWTSYDGQIMGGAESLNPMVSAPGLYVLTAIDQLSSCASSDSVEVFGNSSQPFVDIGDDVYLQLGDSLMLEIESNLSPYQVQWLIDDQLKEVNSMQLEVRPTQTASYSIIIEDENGCTATDEIMVFVDKSKTAFIPNIFTPNNDGDNDRFTVYANESVELVSLMQIYDRWGDLVFEAKNFSPNDPSLGWDGTVNGTPLNNAVFVYYVKLELINGKQETLYGDLTLNR